MQRHRADTRTHDDDARIPPSSSPTRWPQCRTGPWSPSAALAEHVTTDRFPVSRIR
ncbi:hypothetical protein [Kocuria sp.]|uniref:hypothetical protein n=1 Tax=Kocuria sp. TaxID=1871328 RepID=UPI0026DFCBCF|nr:hypothetical protein [Kocuria sp.]MDO5619317.1 hypothetical protein [Kocuria sp.]